MFLRFKHFKTCVRLDNLWTVKTRCFLILVSVQLPENVLFYRDKQKIGKYWSVPEINGH